MANVYVIEEGTTNYISSPHVGIAVTQGGGDSIYTVTRPEPNSIRMERIGEGSYAYIGDTHIGERFKEGDIWTISFEARGYNCDMSRSRVQLWLNSNSPQDIISASDVPPKKPIPSITEEWQKYEYSFKVPPDVYDHTRFRILVSGWLWTIGAWIELRKPQLEKRSYATSFAHGDMGEGYSWTGTPHKSVSIREPSSISMPSPEPESLYIRYSEDGEIWNNEYVSFENKPEDAEPTLLLSPDGSYDRDGEVTPTLSGGVIEVPGQYGNAWQVAEATTNLISSQGGANWNTTLAIISGVGPAAVLKITTTQAYGDHGVSYVGSPFTKKTAATLTFSVDVRADVPIPSGMTVRLLREWETGSAYPNNRESTQLPIAITTQWQRVSITTNFPDESSRAQAVVRLQGWVATAPSVGPVEFYTRNAQIEEKPYATQFTVGYRASATISVPTASHMNFAQGTMILRIKPRYDLPAATQYPTVFWIAGTGAKIDSFITDAVGGNEMWMNIAPASGAASRSARGLGISPTAPPNNSPTTLIYRWNPEKFGFTYSQANGWATANRTNYDANDIIAPTLMLSSASANAFGGDIESVLIFGTALTDAEVARISALDEAWTWEEATDFKVTSDLGQHAKIRYVDNNLKLLTDKKLYIGTVIGFSRPLSEKEIEILDSTPLEYISGKTLLNLPETTVGVSQLL